MKGCTGLDVLDHRPVNLIIVVSERESAGTVKEIDVLVPVHILKIGSFGGSDRDGEPAGIAPG